MESNLSQRLLQLLLQLFDALNGGKRVEFLGILVDRQSIRLEQTARQVAVLLKVVEAVLNQIASQTLCTKRDIYYMNTRLFQSQSSVNAALLQIQTHLNVPQQALNVRSSGKGLVYGHLQILHCDSTIDALQGKETLIPSMECITAVKVSTDTETRVIVVEKDALFQLLVQSFGEIVHRLKCNVILVTGKGFPCQATTNLLKHLQQAEQVVEIVGLFDLDPFGLCIYKTYRFGGKTVKNPINIKYIGIRPVHLQQYLMSCAGDKCISQSFIQQCSPLLSERDCRILNGLANCPLMMEQERPRECIEFLRQFERKFELEAVYEHGFGNMLDLLQSELGPQSADCEFVAIL